MKRFAFLVLFPSELAAQASADSVARPISLDEAVRLAQRNSPSTVQASGAIRANSASVRSAYLAFVPSLSFNTGASKQNGDRFDSQGQLVPFTGQAWQYSSGLTANLQLFDGGGRFYDLKSAKASVSSAEASETAARYNVALNVKQQFYAVLAAREAEIASQAQLEQAQEQLKTATAKVTAGAATKSDSLRAVIQVGNAQLSLLQARNALNIANASLTRLVATPFVVTANPSDSTESLELRADSAEIAVLALRGPAVLQAEEAHTVAKIGARSAMTTYWPTITLNFNRGGNGVDNRFGWGDSRYAYSQTMRMSLNFPFFNQGTREEQVVRARVAEDNAAAQLRDARFLAQQQLTQYLSAFRTAELRIQIQLASVEAAEEDLRVQQRRYSLGASTFLDVVTSQVTLNQARGALIQARFDARVAKAQIETLTGRDM